MNRSGTQGRLVLRPPYLTYLTLLTDLTLALLGTPPWPPSRSAEGTWILEFGIWSSLVLGIWSLEFFESHVYVVPKLAPSTGLSR